MSFLHLFAFSRLKYLFILILILPLTACLEFDPAGTSVESASSTFGALGLTWSTPVLREDGTVLINNEISGYRIYYGATAGDYQNQVDIDSGSNSAQISAIPSGTYYAVVTAVDVDGRESLYSAEVVITV